MSFEVTNNYTVASDTPYSMYASAEDAFQIDVVSQLDELARQLPHEGVTEYLEQQGTLEFSRYAGLAATQAVTSQCFAVAEEGLHVQEHTEPFSEKLPLASGVQKKSKDGRAIFSESSLKETPRLWYFFKGIFSIIRDDSDMKGLAQRVASKLTESYQCETTKYKLKPHLGAISQINFQQQLTTLDYENDCETGQFLARRLLGL